MSHRPSTGTLMVGARSRTPTRIGAPAPVDLFHSMVGGYRIERELGRGAMGAVYLAVHPLLNTSAAVKVLHQDFQQNPDLRERFVAEARAVAALRHPHIVQIYDLVSLPDDRLAIVMEHLDGETLEQRAGVAPMAPTRVRSILLQLCSALGLAHGQGIVHRDLKAQNIVVLNAGAKDYVKLLDFGLVKHEAQDAGLTTPGMVLGTPYYMAPEQVTGIAIDRRTDVYALGVLAYRLLTGHVPFEGTATQVMFQHVQSPVPESPHITGDLRTVVLKALAKRKEERFADVNGLARALRACRLDIAKSAPAPRPPPFTSDVQGRTIYLRFISDEAFQQVERYELSASRLFIPAEPPRVAGLLRLVIDVPGRPLQEAPATLLGVFDRRAAEKHGIPEGFAVTLRGQLTPCTIVRPVAAEVTPRPPRPRQKRIAQRLPVVFGTGPTATMQGVTTNVSLTGICLRAPVLVPAGTSLALSLTLPWHETALLHGTVMWSRESRSPELPHGAIGVRLTQTDEHYVRWVSALSDGTLLDAAPGVPSSSEEIDIDIVEESPEEDSVPTQKVWLRGAPE